jgi:FAD/FMN-containing dehydrogenase
VGGVRDYVLGATLLNGRAELLSFGGQVMKNVAGYDVSRLLAGSDGHAGRDLRGVAEGAAATAGHATLALRARPGQRHQAPERMGRPAAAAERQRLVGRHAGAAPVGRRARPCSRRRRASAAKSSTEPTAWPPSGPGCATTATSSSSAR